MRLRSHHVSTPEDLLRLHNFDIPTALGGFDSWRPMLEATCETVRAASGLQGGIRMDRGVVLYSCVRFLRPEVVIETGVGPGVPTSFLLAGLIDSSIVPSPVSQRLEVSEDSGSPRPTICTTLGVRREPYRS